MLLHVGGSSSSRTCPWTVQRVARQEYAKRAISHRPSPAPPSRPPSLFRKQVELRNLRFEEHSALIEHTPFLRRNKKRRSLSFNDNSRWAEHAAKAAAATVAKRQGASEIGPLRKPHPLDLPTIVTPGVAQNQGTDAEEALRAVGLTTVAGPGTKAREQGGAAAEGSVPPPSEEGVPFSPPHLFWKAVVVAPSGTRGNVGAWLEAKFSVGGGGAAGGASEYGRDLAAHGLCPEQEGGAASLVEGHEEAACGSSGSSKLIYRALR